MLTLCNKSRVEREDLCFVINKYYTQVKFYIRNSNEIKIGFLFKSYLPVVIDVVVCYY